MILIIENINKILMIVNKILCLENYLQYIVKIGRFLFASDCDQFAENCFTEK